MDDKYGSIEERVSGLFTTEARLQTWLDVEAALAQCQAQLGIIPEDAAVQIAAAAKIENIDMDEYQLRYKKTKHPLVPLLDLLKQAAGPAGEYVHLGATTHDVVDIAKMVMMKQVWDITEQVLLDIEGELVRLMEAHSGTLMAGRTHNIQALPITFGFKAAVWASEIGRDIQRLRESRERVFAVTFSGASGTMSSFDGKGAQLESMLASHFGLSVPDLCWHAARDRVAELAGILAIIGGTLGRIAQEVYLLMGTETGELSEGYTEGLVGSSAMPHKINPINSQHIMGDSRTLRYDAAHCLECMRIDHEHNLIHVDDERTTLEHMGVTMADLLHRSWEMISTLYVNKERMRRNLDLLKGAVESEAVMLALGKKIGKMTAKGIVTELAVRAVREDVPLAQLLKEDQRVSGHLTSEEIDQLLDPAPYGKDAAAIALSYAAKVRARRKAEGLD